MEAVILAGGMGTRLRSVITDIPKPMAPVRGRPFLAYLLDQLLAHGVQRAVLATGYRHEAIEEYFGAAYGPLTLTYSREEMPLGTGGAIKKAVTLCRGADILVLNGDTFFAVDLAGMRAFHRRQAADITVALKSMDSCDRYGTVELLGERIMAFREKRAGAAGQINGGIYLLRRELLDGSGLLPERFSFEIDFLQKSVNSLNMCGFRSDAYFIDIGIPEDYERAGREHLLLRPAALPGL